MLDKNEIRGIDKAIFAIKIPDRPDGLGHNAEWRKTLNPDRHLT